MIPPNYLVPEMLIRLHEVFTRMSNISHYYCYDTCTSHVFFNVHETYALKLSCGANAYDALMLEHDDDNGWGETPISKLHLARYQGKVRNDDGYMVMPQELQLERQTKAAAEAEKAKQAKEVELKASLDLAFMNERIHSSYGLCASVAHTSQLNARRIKYIIDTFIEWFYGTTLTEYEMQSAPRASNEWKRVRDLPQSFNDTVYRLRKYADE